MSVKRLEKEIPVAAIVYDLIPFRHQEKYLSDKQIRGAYMRRLGNLRDADVLLSISEHREAKFRSSWTWILTRLSIYRQL